MTIYETFCCSSLDTGSIGLATEPISGGNLFTPIGAKLIGWTEQSNAHFCFLEGFGETVFAVNPVAAQGEFVYPVARSFPDFLGLILACRGTAAIVNAWCWSRLRFQQYLSAQSLSYKQRSTLKAIQNTYAPPSISDPYGYLLEVRQGFDGGGLKFTPELSEYVELPKNSEFSVSFLSSFSDRKTKGRPGKKLTLNTAFSWGGNAWQIPAIYICQEGIVLDFCVAFDGEPQAVNVSAALMLNGKRLPEKRGCSIAWNPLADNDCRSLRLVNHYGCDREKGWVFLRKSFFWHNKRRSGIHSLQLTLQAPPVPIPGPQFQTPPVGESVSLVHPTTGSTCTLTVKACTQEVLDENFLFDYPRNYTRMVYTLSPELPDTAFTIRDSAENDPSPEPVILRNGAVPDGAVGIIGGADGPTAIFLSGPTNPGCHETYSAFHYAPQETVTWRAAFIEKPFDDLTLELLKQ